MAYQKKSDVAGDVSSLGEVQDAIRALTYRVQQLAEITSAQTEEMTKVKFALGELNNRVSASATNTGNYSGTKTYQ